MVHKRRPAGDPMDAEMRRLDKQQDVYLKNMEADMKKTEDEYKRTIKEAEATAIGIYEGVKGMGTKVVALGKSAKRGIETIKLGAKELGKKFKKAKQRPKWFERESIRVGISPEILKKREEEEKKYVRIEEE